MDSGRRRHAGWWLALLAVIDLWLFGRKFIQLQPTAPDPMWTETVALIGTPDSRVLPWGVDIFSQNGAWQAGLNSVFGYNALEVGANQAFAASVPDPRSAAYDILGAGYVVAGVPLTEYEEGPRPLTPVGRAGDTWVYRRGRVLDLARLVYGVEVIPGEAAAVARVHQPDFDPAAAVILAAEPPCAVTPPEQQGTAVVVARRDGWWRIRTDSQTPALLVLSETAYPGWRVTVDGQPAALLTAYTAVRAVCVPAGDHEVVWQYVPTIYGVGGLASLLGLLAVAAAARRRRAGGT